MTDQARQSGHDTARFLPAARLQSLFDALHAAGYQVIGPTLDQEAIVYDEIASVDDLPRGWTDEQQAGQYRLRRRDDEAYFGYVVGPHSWKRFLFPPLATVAVADRTDAGWQMRAAEDEPPQYAFLGVRACEIAAIEVQDRTFLHGAYVDPVYQKRRQAALLVAVNCTQAASTCFCTSMDTGPRCRAGYDLALTEIDNGFVVEIGSDKGANLVERLDEILERSQGGGLAGRDASNDELSAAEAARQRAVDQISKQLDTTDIRDLLLGNLEHPQWDKVAERCLSCTNCTMVCPTCFCSTVREVSDLRGDHVERQREWDSCFNFNFSYMNGGVVRNDIRTRYRQWLTHKLASWHDQFGVSGCVGCGRCITWCPVGIDLTEEVAAIRDGGRATSIAAEASGEEA